MEGHKSLIIFEVEEDYIPTKERRAEKEEILIQRLLWAIDMLNAISDIKEIKVIDIHIVKYQGTTSNHNLQYRVL